METVHNVHEHTFSKARHNTVCVRVHVRVCAIERKGSELSSKSEHRVLPSSPTHEFSLITLHTDMI